MSFEILYEVIIISMENLMRRSNVGSQIKVSH